MDKETHIGTAFLFLFIAGIFFYLIKQFDFFVENIHYTIPIFIGVVFPDILEPPIHWTHRKKFHSKRCLKIISLFLIGLASMSLIFNWFIYIFFFIVGYIIHLLGDSTTPVGLPY